MRARKLTAAQHEALRMGQGYGFCRTTKLSRAQEDAGVTMNTVTGLVRRGWLAEGAHGIFKITKAGEGALDEALLNDANAGYSSVQIEEMEG